MHPVDTPEQDVIGSCSALVLTDAAVRGLMAEMPREKPLEKSDDDDELKYLLKIEYSVVGDDSDK